MDLSSVDKNTLKLAANTIRVLSAEGVEKAGSGHPGMPMGMAELSVVLWLKYLNATPKDTKWINRDRFVLSNGHGSMLLYSMLHLSGYPVTKSDLGNFRQWKSNTPGHPESFMTEGVECTTGPLGQGISNAVGMALGEACLRARFSKGQTPISHKTYCFLGDGCLMEGISSEASSLAGHLGLGNLIAIYDDNDISIAGHTDLAFTEDVAKRYESYGWQIISCDGHNLDDIDRAFSEAYQETGKPSLIIARTVIGKGSPNKANSSGVHGSPLGEKELSATKQELGWSWDEPFYVPEEVSSLFANRAEEVGGIYSSWQESYSAWRKDNSEHCKELDSTLSRELPADLSDKLVQAAMSVSPGSSSRKLSSAVLVEAAKNIPSIIGGSADLEPSTLTLIPDSSDVTAGDYSGKNIRFGVREHAMGAIMNGLSYYGGFIPFGSTFMCFSDYMRPSIRLASLSNLQGLFIFTHDSIFLGEDGPTHQPVEHLSSLRAMPGVLVFRPASALETAVSYSLSLEEKERPSVFSFTRQGIPEIEGNVDFDASSVRKGAYAIYETNSSPEVVFVATGSEVPLALAAAKQVEGDKSVRVISMPCVELFKEQDEKYGRSLFPEGVKTVIVEAGSPHGWGESISPYAQVSLSVTIPGFGASAPAKILAEKYGFTVEQIVKRVKEL